MTVDADVVGSIGAGLLVFVGVTDDDTGDDARVLADKIAGLRIFADENAAMNRSVVDVDGSVLVVSQFTLYADVRKGRRPSFGHAAGPDRAEPLVEAVASAIESHGVRTERGRFGAHMDVTLVNDGPVTITMETVGGRLV